MWVNGKENDEWGFGIREQNVNCVQNLKNFLLLPAVQTIHNYDHSTLSTRKRVQTTDLRRFNCIGHMSIWLKLKCTRNTVRKISEAYHICDEIHFWFQFIQKALSFNFIYLRHGSLKMSTMRKYDCLENLNRNKHLSNYSRWYTVLLYYTFFVSYLSDCE